MQISTLECKNGQTFSEFTIMPNARGREKKGNTDDDGTIPAAFKVTNSKVSPNGVIIVNYERVGAITTNTVSGSRHP